MPRLSFWGEVCKSLEIRSSLQIRVLLRIARIQSQCSSFLG